MNAPKPPQLLERSKREDIYKRTNNIKKYLLEMGGFKTIQQAKKDFGADNINEVYDTLLENWNAYVDSENKIRKEKYRQEAKKYIEEQNKKLIEKVKTETKQNVIKKREQATRINNKKRENRQRRKKQIKQETILINAVLEVVYIYHKLDDNGRTTTRYSKPIIINKTLGPLTINEDEKTNENITSIIETLPEFKNPYMIVKILSYKIVVMDTKILNGTYKKQKSKVMMKNAFILKNDWLKYAENIADIAYKNTEGECVYSQLEQFLKCPPAGNPTKFLNGQRINKDVLFNYFNSITDKEETAEFNIKTGVNCEMLGKLCRDLKRNMYAYNENDKCFYSITSNDSKNYCPLTFYCMEDHFYLINDKEATKSIAESNKKTAKKIKSSIVENEIDEKEEIKINHIETLQIENIKQMNEGYYLLQQSNLNDEVIKYIISYEEQVKTNSRENVVISMTFKNKDKKNVCICVDANYGKNIPYEQIQKVAKFNNIDYVNEGIGSVVYKLLQKFLTPEPTEAEIVEDEEISETETEQEEEKKEPTYDLNKYISSTFNDIAKNQIINTQHFKTFQFVEKLQYDTEQVKELNQFKIDMNKCRRNNLYFSDYEFPKYSIMDMPTNYNGVIKCGMYYIITENTFPFRGCGWYFEPLIKYGLDNNLITEKNILYEFIPYNTLPNDYFKTHIDILLDAFSCEPDLQKLAINSLIGVWGITKQKSCKSIYTISPYTASQLYYEENNNKNVFIKNHPINEEKTIYECLLSEEVLTENTNYCLYAMILQMEALELHKMETLILENGGIPLDRNTDAIRYASKNKIDILPYCYDKENKVRKYKDEEPKELQVEKLKDYKRLANLDTFYFGLKWNIQYGYGGKTVEETVSNIIASNKSYHIDGRAGTGKTYLVNKIIEELEKQEKKYIGVSPTNKGARLIGGKTIDSYYYKFTKCKKGLMAVLEKIEYIFIDEVSMMKENFYTLFIMIKRALPHIKFIISGDFGQLPPVLDSWSGDYENSVGLWSLCDSNKIKLNEFKRGDKELFLLCRDVDKIRIEDFRPKQKTYLNIAYTHNTRIRVNNECMERYIKQHNKQVIYIPKDEKNEKTQDVKLCQGMPIIAHKTNKKLDIMNSEKFTIKQIDTNKIIINNGDDDITIKTDDFHKYFYVGFCITIHASQGETFKEAYTIYDWGFVFFCNKAKYVALSRATSIQNIQICL